MEMRALLLSLFLSPSKKLTMIWPSMRRSVCSNSQIWTRVRDWRKRKIRF